MITPAEFRTRWTTGEDHLLAFPADRAATLRVSTESRQFLIDAGLPDEAAPFLSFGPVLNQFLPTVTEVYGLSADLERYRVIGSTGYGDPLCIDESATGEIVCLVHDNDFQRVFVNSGVPQLAESLLAVRDVPPRQSTSPGEKRPSEDGSDLLREALHRIDPPAVEPATFWYEECMALAQPLPPLGLWWRFRRWWRMLVCRPRR